MLMLAVDQSTICGSLALLRDEQLLDQASWLDTSRHNRQLFAQINGLLGRTAVGLSQLDCLAVGLGPGSYTGLRIAIAAALGLAMPDGLRLYGVSSAEALAGEVLAESGVASALVIGDARRRQLWARRFALREGRCLAISPWLLCPPASLADQGAAVWVTADWDRIGSLLKAQAPAGCHLLEESRRPSAPAVGRAALARIRAQVPSEPLAPIYLHAAVAAPRVEEAGPNQVHAKYENNI
jgi:tRNA threonylcarbamoyl adenosine modification protein YeaZ